MPEPIKVAAVPMLIDDQFDHMTILIPISDQETLNILKEHNNGMEIELSPEQWERVWAAKWQDDGSYQMLEIVEHYNDTVIV